jgi:hypothetical protein
MQKTNKQTKKQTNERKVEEKTSLLPDFECRVVVQLVVAHQHEIHVEHLRPVLQNIQKY